MARRAEPKLKTCAVCGTEFETNYGKKLYCSPKCRYEAALERDRRYKAKRREENKAYWRKANPVRRVSQIDEKEAAARAAGLSYGKYVARNM